MGGVVRPKGKALNANRLVYVAEAHFGNIAANYQFSANLNQISSKP